MFKINRKKLVLNSKGRMIRKCGCCRKVTDCRPLVRDDGGTVNVCAWCAFAGLVMTSPAGGGLVGRMTRESFK